MKYTPFPVPQATVTMASDGSFMVAWHDKSGVFAQRFNALGEALGTRIQISTDANTTLPKIASSSTLGNFVVVWGLLDPYDVYVYQPNWQFSLFDGTDTPLTDSQSISADMFANPGKRSRAR